MTLAPAVFKAETWAVGEGERCKSLDYQLTDTSPESLDRLPDVLVRFMVRLSVKFVITLLL